MLVRKCTWIQTVSKTSQKVFQVWKQIVRQWLVEVRQWIWLELLFQIIICLQVQQFQVYILRRWINFCSEWRAEDIKLRFQVLKVVEPSIEFDSQGIQLNFILCCKFTRNFCFFQQRKMTQNLLLPACLENNDSFIWNDFTCTYISCANIPLSWSFTFNSFNFFIISMANLKSNLHSSSTTLTIESATRSAHLYTVFCGGWRSELVWGRG